MNALGVSFGYHDSAAALVIDGRVVAAAQEERFSRIKNDDNFPSAAIEFCLKEAGLKIKNIDAITYYEDHFLKLDRIINSSLVANNVSYLAKNIDFYISNNLLDIKKFIAQKLDFPIEKIHSYPHHLSHASSAFYCSPFDRSAILSVDGVGEYDTISFWRGTRDGIEKLHSISLPNSLGLVYSAFTSFLGFEVNEGEYKVMGMAPFGKPIYMDKIRLTFKKYQDGEFEVDETFYEFITPSKTMYTEKFVDLFGEPRPQHLAFFTPGYEQWASPSIKASDLPDIAKRNSYYADIAASLQAVTEDIMISLSKRAMELSGESNLCIGGGVGLNSVANAKIKKVLKPKGLFVQPASGDAGSSIGSALYHYHTNTKKTVVQPLVTALLGKSYSYEEIKGAINASLPLEEVFEFDNNDELVEFVVNAICDKKVIGLLNGRFEWGPRALGARSILADPRGNDIKHIVNEKIKFRELFRPFAPSVLAEFAHEWFELEPDIAPSEPENFMLSVVNVKSEKKAIIPAVTHVDGTARVHLVREDVNPFFYKLIKAFYAKSGVPMLLNTSFNLKGEPVVSSPKDAILSFSYCHMDYLVMSPFVVKSYEGKNRC